MIGAGVQPLTLQVNLGGEAGVKSGLDAIGRGAKSAEKSVGAGATGLRRWLPSLSGIRSSIGSIVGSLGSIPGMLGVGLGALGLGKVVGEVLDYDKALVSFKNAAGLSADEIGKLDGKLTTLAETIGKSRGELLKAVRTGEDFGMSWTDAVDAVQSAWSLSEVWQTDLEETMKNVALIRRAAPGTTTEEAVGWLRTAQAGSGVAEKDFSSMINRIMTASEEGIRAAGPNALATLSGILAGAGGTGFGRMTAGAGAMGDLLKLVSGRGAGATALGKNKEWAALGTAESRITWLREQYVKMGGTIEGVDSGLLDLIGALDPSRIDEFTRAISQGSSDYIAAAADVAKAGEEIAATPSVTFAAMLEQIKGPLIDGIRTALSWIIENKDTLREAGQMLLASIKALGTAFMGLVDGVEWVLRKLGVETEKGLTPEQSAAFDRRAAAGKGVMRAMREGSEEEQEAARIAYLASMPVRDRVSAAQRFGGGDAVRSAALLHAANQVRIQINVEPSLGAAVRADTEGAAVTTIEGANA